MGDLAEREESPWQGLLGVLGLVIRRHAMLWKTWRPWLAALGLACPASFLLMGYSLAVTLSFQRVIGSNISAEAWLLLISRIVSLAARSWTAGFVVGSISRRTLWASAACCCLPCLFCLERFRGWPLSRFGLLLFLIPAICGIRKGLRLSRIRRATAIVLAIVVTLSTIPAWIASVWTLNWLLLWPSWYLVANSKKGAKT